MAELADCASLCGQVNRAAPFARDMVRRFFEKSVEQGQFFGDVRMSLEHFDDLAFLASPFLPSYVHGPTALEPRLRTFCVVFWLAQGCRQRVAARCLDIGQSTMCKYVRPVVTALLQALYPPQWPNEGERLINENEFSMLKGGDLPGWKGLYVAILNYGGMRDLHLSFESTRQDIAS